MCERATVFARPSLHSQRFAAMKCSRLRGRARALRRTRDNQSALREPRRSSALSTCGVYTTTAGSNGRHGQLRARNRIGSSPLLANNSLKAWPQSCAKSKVDKWKNGMILSDFIQSASEVRRTFQADPQAPGNKCLRPSPPPRSPYVRDQVKRECENVGGDRPSSGHRQTPRVPQKPGRPTDRSQCGTRVVTR